jgi:hypothetical protein
MAQDDIQVTLSGLTELERLDLEQTVGKEFIQVVPHPTPSGQIGEPGTLDAIIRISEIAIPIIGTNLAIWLSAKRSGRRFKDKIVIETPRGNFRREVSITSTDQEAAKPELVEHLTKFAEAASKQA